MNINNCHKLCQQMAEGIQTAEVRMLYCASVPITSHRAQALMFSQRVRVHAHVCNVLSYKAYFVTADDEARTRF